MIEILGQVKIWTQNDTSFHLVLIRAQSDSLKIFHIYNETYEGNENENKSLAGNLSIYLWYLFCNSDFLTLYFIYFALVLIKESPIHHKI